MRTLNSLSGTVVHKLVLGLLFIFLSGLWTSGKAQPLEVGITAGINVSTHTEKFLKGGEGPFTPKTAAGYQGGVMVRWNLTKAFQLQLEPSLIKLGARYNELFIQDGTEFHTESWTRLLYLQFPLLIHFSPVHQFGIQSENTRYYLIGGIFGDYLLDARLNGTYYQSPGFDARQEGEFSKDVIFSYSKYDAGYMLGIGAELDEKINFSVRFQQTVFQTYNSEPRYTPKNLAVTFSVTYLLFP